MKKLKLSIIVALLSMTSCSLFQEKAPDHTGKYILNTAEKGPVHHYTIKKALTRSKIMAGGDYEVKAYPFTESLVLAMANDLTFERGLTEEQNQQLLQTLKDLYLKDKSCFHFNTAIMRFEKASELKNWKVQMIDNKEKEHKMEWIKTDPKIATFQRRSSDKLIKWLNEATACTTYAVAFLSPFTLKVSASYAPFPFSTTGLLHWEYDTYEQTTEGPKRIKKDIKESRTKKRYRGW